MTTSIDNVSRRGFLAGMGIGASGLVLTLSPQILQARPSRLAEEEESDLGSAAFSPNVYVQIADSGKVQLIVHRTEMGQGVRTSMPMLLAEELEVDLDEVELIQAIGDRKYGNQNTDGSTSVRLNWDSLRQAGAAARMMLVSAAAKQWGVAESECRAESGAVLHEPTASRLSYGELATAAAALPVPSEIELKPKSEWKILGKPQVGLDAKDMVTGKSEYGIDVRLPGMVYASIERSPTVRGKLGPYQKEAALAVSGVKQLLELESLPQPLNINAGVAVIAENTWGALQGRKALGVEWDHGSTPLENSDDYRKKLEGIVAGSGKSIRSEGDFAAAKKSAAKVIEASYHGPYLVHAPMAPPAATALVKGDQCSVWAPSQDPQTAQQMVALALGVDVANVTVNVTMLGGGFGRKSKPDFIIEAALLARKMEGTPVKVVFTREDEVQHGFYRAENMQKLEATLDADNKVTGWRHHTAFPTILSTFMAGASEPAPFELGMGFTNMPYRFENVALEASGVASDLRIGWLRSVCNTFHALSVNCFMDELAEATGKDPVAYRLEMLGEPRKIEFSERDQPYGMETGRLSNVIEEAAKLSKWGEELPTGWGHGFASHFSFLAYFAMAVKASLEDGKVRVHEVDVVTDIGTVVNPDTVVAQIEGSVAFALSMALFGEITVRDGVVRQSNFHNYKMLRIGDMPKVNVQIVDSDAPPSGVGEPGVPPVAPAMLNAIYAATGKRYRDLPLSRQGLA